MSTWKLAAAVRRQPRIIPVVLGSIWLAGCFATAPDVQQRSGESFVGKNVDEIVVVFGPPKTTFNMNSGDIAYLWEIGNSTNIDTYKGSGSAETSYCRFRVIASPQGIVSDLSTEDASNGDRESPCARRLGMKGQSPSKTCADAFGLSVSRGFVSSGSCWTSN
jgi:hypothetical protein